MNVVFIQSQMKLDKLREECLSLIGKNSIIGIPITKYTEEELKDVVNNMGDNIDSVCICPEETFMSSEDFLNNYKKEKGDERLYLLNTIKFIK